MKHSSRILLVLVLAVLFLTFAPLPIAHAAGVVGTGTSASCTEAALTTMLAGGGSVTFNCGGAATITLTTTKTIAADTTINGGGVITLSGGGTVRLFTVNSSVTLTLQNLIITNGQTPTEGGAISSAGNVSVTNVTFTNNTSGTGHGGGAIYICGGALTVSNSIFTGNTESGNGGGAISDSNECQPTSITITNSAFVGNHATAFDGGAINSAYDFSITGSTFSGNVAEGSGGAIYHTGGNGTIVNSTFAGNSGGNNGGGAIYFRNDNNLTMNNVTIALNTATSGVGGGLFFNNQFGTGVANIANTIIAGNFNATVPDCFGSINSLGYNLIQTPTSCTVTGVTTGNIYNVTPNLGALGSNGGSTQTMAIVSASPAYNAGNPAAPGAFPACATTDQRGVTRPQLGRCDIGAFEYQQPLPQPTPAPKDVPESDTLLLMLSGLGGFATWVGWQSRKLRGKK